jgi:phenylacetate-CoA ligase
MTAVSRAFVVADRVLRVQREQWLAPEELERRQWSRFQKVLRHAFENTPFYARKYRDAGLTPGEIRDRGDVARLPVVTRAELRHPEALVPERLRPDTLRYSFSSGSTGESVKTYFDPEGWLTGKHLLKLRARWACGVRPWDRAALFRAGSFTNSRLKRVISRQTSFSVHEPVDRILPDLRQLDPTVLYGFPSHFKELAEIWPRDLRPRRIFTSGEMLDDESRKRIEAALGGPVYDIYGCTEVKEIAWECPTRDGYHVNSDWLLVETLEEDGAIVVTSLYNYGMPLIRYRLGDTGKLLSGRCRCGRTLPLMAPGFGRSVDTFRLPDGARVSPYTLINAVEVLPDIRQFQIVQESAAGVAVAVVPGPGFDDRSIRSVRSVLAPHLPGVTIEVRSVESIPREPSGKYRMALSRVAQPAPRS